MLPGVSIMAGLNNKFTGTILSLLGCSTNIFEKFMQSKSGRRLSSLIVESLLSLYFLMFLDHLLLPGIFLSPYFQTPHAMFQLKIFELHRFLGNKQKES